jgi:Spy/CpxP family protein refolding chaperone
MGTTRIRTALYLALVFVCGAAVGAFGHRFYTVSSVSANVGRRSPEEFRRRLVEEMRSRLKLSDEQVQKLGAILDESRTRVRAARQTIEPEMRKIREDQQQQIRAMLNDEQRAEYEKMRAEREAEMQRRRTDGPVPGAPASGASGSAPLSPR